MKTMNVTAKHGYNAVHLGGREYTNGRWTPACRIQHNNSGGRTPSALYPTTEDVTCKRCLKVMEQDAKNDAPETQTRPAPAAVKTADVKPAARKAKSFTFEYDASEGVLIAAALRDKALVERELAKSYRTNAEYPGSTLVKFYNEQARIADNRAKLLEDAADRLHKPVREAISKAVANAIPDEPEPKFHRQVKDAIGLRW
jgi:hypothetical protein